MAPDAWIKGPPRRLRRSLLLTSPSLDMTPLIDTMLQLLIFFMLTSAFVSQPGIEIHLPKTITTDVLRRENVQVTVGRDHRLYLGDTVITLADLKRTLARPVTASAPVLIRADREASMGRVVEVWDACRAAGISQVNIATDVEQTDP